MIELVAIKKSIAKPVTVFLTTENVSVTLSVRPIACLSIEMRAPLPKVELIPLTLWQYQ
jgi:hypothetical protein